jgi:hypothetical protein
MVQPEERGQGAMEVKFVAFPPGALDAPAVLR